MFDENNYSNAQLEAIRYSEKNLLLIAGPGSGKTHTMTGRILYLTEVEGVSPSDILVITFTKDSAMGMQRRFNKESDGSTSVAFGTFHSVFYNMICQYKKPSAPTLIFDKAKAKIVKSVSSKFAQSTDDGEIEELSGKILTLLTIYKNTLNAEKSCSILPEKYRNFFNDILNYYESIRIKNDLMDFDDMVYDCLQLLKKDSGFRDKWRGRFKYILIDEFQDINPVQYETVKNLVSDKTKVFAVGDDDQSIYGFRGSDPSCINKYIDELDAGVLHLDTNYRSAPAIVSSSLKVINLNENRIKKALNSGKPESTDDEVKVIHFSDKESEYKEIINLDADKSISRAVLFRTNLDMQYFASFLSGRNIPYYIREKTNNMYDHIILQDILNYFEASYQCSKEAIKYIINRPQRFINTEAIISCDGDIERMIPYIFKNKGIRRQADKIRNLTILKNDLLFMKNLSPRFALEYLYNKVGYRKYALSLAGNNDRIREEYSLILEKASEICSMADTYEELTDIKDIYEDDLKKSISKKPIPGALNLMTVHASKGLEFDTVFIPDCNEGTFPYGKMQDEDTIEEERRLFYVGMTRAVSKLYLLYISGDNEGKKIPSRFIYPLIK